MVEGLDGTRPEFVHCAYLTKYGWKLGGKPVLDEDLEVENGSKSRHKNFSFILDIGKKSEHIWIQFRQYCLPYPSDHAWALALVFDI